MRLQEEKVEAPLHGKTDWDRLHNMTDDDIQQGIDSDPDSAPAMGYEETKAAYKPAPARIGR